MGVIIRLCIYIIGISEPAMKAKLEVDHQNSGELGQLLHVAAERAKLHLQLSITPRQGWQIIGQADQAIA